MADDNISNLPQHILLSGRASRDWKDESNTFSKILPRGSSTVLLRTYLNDWGKPCGCALIIEEDSGENT